MPGDHTGRQTALTRLVARGERTFPPLRFFPADTCADHWLHSTEIELSE